MPSLLLSIAHHPAPVTAHYCHISATSNSTSIIFPSIFTLSTIVGYASNALDDKGGAVAVAPQFVNIGAETGLRLKDVTPINSTGATLRRNIIIQLLDNAGTKTVAYRWDGQNGKTWIAEKSVDDMGETVIPAGQGLWVLNNTMALVSLRSAGQVGTSDIIQPLDAQGGAAMVANSFPVPVKLKDIVVSTDTESVLRRNVVIQLLDNAGSKVVAYRWDGQNGKTWIAEKATTDMGDTEIPAGTAMWVVNSAKCQASMRIAAPEL